MKHIRLMIAAAVCGLALMFIASANAQGVKQGVVTVVRMSGTANYTSDGTTWKPLMLGAILQPGSVIKTDPDSTVDIVLGQKAAAVSQGGGGVGINNAGAYAAGLPPTSTKFIAAVQQNVIRIMAGTELAVDKLTFSDTGAESTSDTELDLKSGKIFGNVKKISAMSKYEIKTPAGVAGVRGTSFSIGSDGSVICYSGSVVVSFNGPNGITTQVVNAGDQFDPATGQVTSLVPPGQSVADWAATATPANAETQATTVGTESVTPTATPYISP
jgi:hypothetical protein